MELNRGPKPGLSPVTVWFSANCASPVWKNALSLVLPVTEAIARIILAEGSAVEIGAQAAKEGVWDLRRAGLDRVFREAGWRLALRDQSEQMPFQQGTALLKSKQL